MSPIINNVGDLIQLKESQVELAAGVLARAFQDDPLWTYFFPNASKRPEKLIGMFRMFVNYSVTNGEVQATSSDLEGVAVWLPSDNADMSPYRMMRSGGLWVMFKMIGGEMARAMRYTEYASAIHYRHAHRPHWYLQFIGIDPAFQGKGFASALLKPMLARMDTDQNSCYLETQNRENVPIYKHYGFRVVEEGMVPGTQVGHWAMLR